MTTTTTAASGAGEGITQLSTIGSALGQIAIAFVGALIAYYVWDWINQPRLSPRKILSKTVKHKSHSKPDQTSHYLQVHNSGRVPATRCRAELRLRGKTEYPEHVYKDDKIIAVNLPLGWADMRGNLLLNQQEDYSRDARVPAGESVTTHLFRETTGYIMLADWVDPSGKPVLHIPDGEYRIDELGQDIGFNDDSGNHDLVDVDYRQNRQIDYEAFGYTDWKVSEVVVSSEEGSAFRQPISLNLTDQGNQLSVSIDD
jgi:hypothetical protein